jgi:hypothetical protein
LKVNEIKKTKLFRNTVKFLLLGVIPKPFPIKKNTEMR